MPKPPPIDDETRPTVEGSNAPAAPATGLRADERLDRYVIIEAIGRGGMGVVYRAYDPSLDRKVALKLVGRRADDTVGQQRLAREAQALARLSHPNVVAVYDVGTQGDEVFIAMELLEGAHLGSWLSAASRSWRDIVGAYAQAGRGLAAAHAAGLVHRDVKPTNIHMDTSGRVRILDFGLAREHGAVARADEPRDAAAPPTPELHPAGAFAVGAGSATGSASLTRPGFAPGTHRYMAPEQHAGVTSPASDQYGFCVALFEALYGRLPWPNESTSVRGPGPRALHAWICTGLRAEPGARHASMSVLVDGLERILRRRRRVAAGLVAATALAAVTALLVVGVRGGKTAAAPCAGAGSEMAAIWDTGRAERLRARLDGVSPSYDPHAGARVVDRMERFAASWSLARVDACEATFVRRSQSEAMLDRRLACLDRRLGSFRSLLGVLDEMDAADALDGARAAAPDASALRACLDLEGLQASPARPAEATARAALTGLERRLERAEALGVAGKYDEGASIAGEVVEAARAAGFNGLAAEALYDRARLEQQGGHGAAAEASLTQALDQASGAGDVRLAARVMAYQVYVVGDLLGRTEEGIGIARSARVVTRLAGDPPEVIAAIQSNLGNLYWLRGRLDEAQAAYAMALELEQRSLGPDHPDVAWSWNNVGMVLEARGDLAGARQHYQRAITITEKALGREHPEVAPFLNNLAMLELEDGKPEAALAAATRGLILVERPLGPDHYRIAELRQTLGDIALGLGEPGSARAHCAEARRIYEATGEPAREGVAAALTCLGRVALATGQPAAAVVDLERALAIYDEAEADPLVRARVKLELARALWQDGRRARARQLGEEAARAHEGRPGRHRQLAELNGWLDQHAAPAPPQR